MTIAAADPDDYDWREAEKFYGLEFAIRTIATRAIEFHVTDFALIEAEDQERIDRLMPKYSGLLPVQVNQKRYVCLYRNGTAAEGV